MPKNIPGNLHVSVDLTDTASRAMIAISQVSDKLAKDFVDLAAGAASLNKILGTGTIDKGLLGRIKSLGVLTGNAAPKMTAFNTSLNRIATKITGIATALAPLNAELAILNSLLDTTAAGGVAAGGVAAGRAAGARKKRGRAAPIVPGGIVTPAGASSFPAPIPVSSFYPAIRGGMSGSIYRSSGYSRQTAKPRQLIQRTIRISEYDPLFLPPHSPLSLPPHSPLSLPLGSSSRGYDVPYISGESSLSEKAAQEQGRGRSEGRGRSGGRGRGGFFRGYGIGSLGFRGSSAIVGGLSSIGGMLGLGTAAGGALTLGGLGLLGVGYSGIVNRSRYENSLASIRGLSQGSMTGISLLRNQAELEGARTPLRGTDYLNIHLGATRAGFSPNEILRMTPAIGKFNLATGLPIPQITNTLAAAGRQFNMKSSKDYLNAVDALFYSGARTTTSVDVLQKGLGFLGGTASAVGMTFPQTLALMAHFKQARGGISQRGIRPVSTAFLGMFKNANKFKAAGFDLFTAGGKQRDLFNEILPEISGAYKSGTDQEKHNILRMFSGGREMIHILKNFDKIKGFHGDILSAAPGATERAYRAPEGTLKREWQKLSAVWEDAMVKGGLTEVIQGIAKGAVKGTRILVDLLALDTQPKQARIAQQLMARGGLTGMRNLAATITGISAADVKMSDVAALIPKKPSALQSRTTALQSKVQTAERQISEDKMQLITDPNVLAALSQTDHEAYNLWYRSRYWKRRSAGIGLSSADAFTYSLRKRHFQKKASIYSHLNAGDIDVMGNVLTKNVPFAKDLFGSGTTTQAFQALSQIEQDREYYRHDARRADGFTSAEAFATSKWLNPLSFGAAEGDPGAASDASLRQDNMMVNATNVYIVQGEQAQGQTV